MMKKSTKKAFTLVELVVVITILLILGTIAFISLQSYTRDARNAKRLSDVSTLSKKISIEIVKWAEAKNFEAELSSGTCTNTLEKSNSSGTWVKFSALNENADSFKDPKGCDYNYTYSVVEVDWKDIAWNTIKIEEQLFEIYTLEEGTNSGVISAWRTLTWHLDKVDDWAGIPNP